MWRNAWGGRPQWPATSPPHRQIYNAWLTTIEDGIHTTDIFRAPADGGVSKVKARVCGCLPPLRLPPSTAARLQVGCKDFAAAVIERLGRSPAIMRPMPEDAPHRERAREISSEVQKWTPPPQLKILTGEGGRRGGAGHWVRSGAAPTAPCARAPRPARPSLPPGVDIFVDWSAGSPDELAALLQVRASDGGGER